MFVTLDTSHFEMSELNALVPKNTAESKKEKRERGEKRRSEKILEQKKEEEMGKWEKREGRCEKKKNELKRTVCHVRHFGHLPFRDVRVECVSLPKRCRVKKRKERARGEKRTSEKILGKKKEEEMGERGGEKGGRCEKKKDELKRTV